MKRQPRKYKVKTHIIGGGLALQKGEIVDEGQLKGYVEWLQQEDGIEEVVDVHSGRQACAQPHQA